MIKKIFNHDDKKILSITDDVAKKILRHDKKILDMTKKFYRSPMMVIIKKSFHDDTKNFIIDVDHHRYKKFLLLSMTYKIIFLHDHNFCFYEKYKKSFFDQQ